MPLHVHFEVMVEEIAVLSARLQQIGQAERALENRKELREIGKALLAMQFQFDPDNEGKVMAMVGKTGPCARAVQPALLHASI